MPQNRPAIGKPRCEGKPKSFYGYCQAPVSCVRDDKYYCWRHDPVRLKKRVDEEQEKRREKQEEDNKLYETKITRKKLLESSGVDKLTNDRLELIIKLGGIEDVLHMAACWNEEYNE